jgi:hypothetical protein
MKLKIALSTASALALLMGTAWAGDNNRAFSIQNGQENLLSVEQNGNNNTAGVRTTYTEYLGQFGNNNSMEITQDGDYNHVADTGPSQAGAIQNKDRNVLVVDQTSGANGYSGGQNGNKVNRVRQTGTDGATATTNSATIIQSLGPNSGSITAQNQNVVASHYVGNVEQTYTGVSGGPANELSITQKGAYSHWYGGGQGNRVNNATQNGSGNQITVSQDGVGPVQSTSGLQQRGPSNVINYIDQTGADNEATVTQNGFQNYVERVSQGGTGGNVATIILNGDHNGATASGGFPTIGAFTSGRGAEAAGASASTVSQTGSSNQVDYTVVQGDSNQFGFYQNGDNNQALAIQITGNGNELGVYQDGQDNSLDLAAISDDDNIFGVRQVGSGNIASIDSMGGKNGGYNSFTAGPAFDLALAQGLTAGLLEQNGISQNVSLTITGSGSNVFASLQGDEATDHDNVITAIQDGSGNQAAVAQLGSSNTATLTQTGGQNNASISQ